MAEIKDILIARASSHGQFDVFSSVAQNIKDAVQASPNWDDLCPVYKEGLDMICHKIARIVSGNPYHIDHIVDLQGYAALMQKHAENNYPEYAQ